MSKFEYIDTDKKYKIRRMGDIMLELEILLNEMVDDHDLQLEEIKALVVANLTFHRPDCIEEEV